MWNPWVTRGKGTLSAHILAPGRLHLEDDAYDDRRHYPELELVLRASSEERSYKERREGDGALLPERCGLAGKRERTRCAARYASSVFTPSSQIGAAAPAKPLQLNME